MQQLFTIFDAYQYPPSHRWATDSDVPAAAQTQQRQGVVAAAVTRALEQLGSVLGVATTLMDALEAQGLSAAFWNGK
jgi:hypothetical protein